MNPLIMARAAYRQKILHLVVINTPAGTVMNVCRGRTTEGAVTILQEELLTQLGVLPVHLLHLLTDLLESYAPRGALRGAGGYDLTPKLPQAFLSLAGEFIGVLIEKLELLLLCCG